MKETSKSSRESRAHNLKPQSNFTTTIYLNGNYREVNCGTDTTYCGTAIQAESFGKPCAMFKPRASAEVTAEGCPTKYAQRQHHQVLHKRGMSPKDLTLFDSTRNAKSRTCLEVKKLMDCELGGVKRAPLVSRLAYLTHC